VQQPARDPEYLLGHSELEQQRLIAQEAVYGPLTERLFRTAGLGEGMRVLDVGCGVGDVSLLVARLVGERGEVTGVDKAPQALATARERARAAGLTNVRFLEADLGTLSTEDTFDAAVGRFVLMHLADPAAGLRSVAREVRAGGIVVFVESDFSIPPLAYPAVPSYEQLSWFWGPPQDLPVERQMGLKLHRAFLDAGLPAPQVHLEVPLGGGPDFPGYEYVASTLRSVLPLLERLGHISPAEIAELQLETLAERLRAEVSAGGGVIAVPAVVGAWVSTPTG
jgi:SAM-dependent methyltransferase